MHDSPVRMINSISMRAFDAINACALTLLSKGYKLSLIFVLAPDGSRKCEYTAAKDGLQITAENEIELLGLVTMRETRGPGWTTQEGEPSYLYDILCSESFDREPDGSLVESPMRWM